MPETATWGSGLAAPAVNLQWKPLSTRSQSPWATTWVMATYLNVVAGNVNPKGNQSWIFIGRTEAEAETPILWPPDAKSWLIEKDPDAGKDGRQEEKRTTEDEMVGWQHWLDGHEFEQAPGVGDRQGSLACCNSWGCKELDTTERLNWTELNLACHWLRWWW